MKEKSYAEYLKEAYGLERAMQMMNRADISFKEVKKLRRIVPVEPGYDLYPLTKAVYKRHGIIYQ